MAIILVEQRPGITGLSNNAGDDPRIANATGSPIHLLTSNTQQQQTWIEGKSCCAR